MNFPQISQFYPIVSFHAFSFECAALLLADPVATGWVCWRGLWAKVCLRGPRGYNLSIVVTLSERERAHCLYPQFITRKSEAIQAATFILLFTFLKLLHAVTLHYLYESHKNHRADL